MIFQIPAYLFSKVKAYYFLVIEADDEVVVKIEETSGAVQERVNVFPFKEMLASKL